MKIQKNWMSSVGRYNKGKKVDTLYIFVQI